MLQVVSILPMALELGSSPGTAAQMQGKRQIDKKAELSGCCLGSFVSFEFFND